MERLVLCVLEMMPKLLEVDTLEAGLPNEGVFVTLKASALNSSFTLSTITKERERLVLRLKRPGPRTESLLAVPKRSWATENTVAAGSAKFAVLKYGRVAVWPPRI